MRRVLIGLLVAFVAYLAGAFLGGWLLSIVSSNTHDRSVEAAMTGAFVTGPLAALAGFIGGFVWAGRATKGRAEAGPHI